VLGSQRRKQPMPRWAIFVVGMYVGAAMVTLGFQTWVRLDQCPSVAPCAVSLAKGVVWSAIWPASWAVYVAGLKRTGSLVRPPQLAASPIARKTARPDPRDAPIVVSSADDDDAAVAGHRNLGTPRSTACCFICEGGSSPAPTPWPPCSKNKNTAPLVCPRAGGLCSLSARAWRREPPSLTAVPLTRISVLS
jgi:hypothetical protein